MIPMACPSCGRKGNVPLDRLNTRMHCKKCDAVFHLDASGKPMLGEPPSAKGTKAKTSSRPKDEPLDPIGIVASKLAQTPKPVWMAGLVLLGLYALYFVYSSMGPPAPTQEMSVTAQVLKAAKAVLDKDAPTLQKMATSDSQEEAAQSIDVFHSIIGPIVGKTEDYMLAAGEPPPEPQGCVEVTVVPPAAADTTEITKSYTMDLCWIKGGNDWFLDGKATLAALQGRAEYEKKSKK